MIVNRLINEEKGVALPLVALMLVVLFGFAALAIDGGNLLLSRRQMVTAADAGALAGAQELSNKDGKDTGEAEKVAKAVAIENGADAGTVTAEVKDVDGRQVIEVNVYKDTQMTVGKVLNLDDVNVHAKSVGTWGYMQNFSGGSIMPFYSFDKHFKLGNGTIKEGKLEVDIDNKNIVLNSNYGYLEVGSGQNGINSLLAVEKHTIPQDIVNEIKIGGVLEGEPGKGQSLIKPIETRMKDAVLKFTGEGKIPARRQYMSGLIPVVDYDEFIKINDKSTYNDDGTIKKPDLKNPLDLPVKYFAIFEILDVVVDNKGKGSEFALNSVTYEKVAKAQDWKGEQMGTVIGRYIDSYVNVDVIITDGDQVNPNPSGYSAKYFRLIDVDYIGD